jgi:hypothetical protein
LEKKVSPPWTFSLFFDRASIQWLRKSRGGGRDFLVLVYIQLRRLLNCSLIDVPTSRLHNNTVLSGMMTNSGSATTHMERTRMHFLLDLFER